VGLSCYRTGTQSVRIARKNLQGGVKPPILFILEEVFIKMGMQYIVVNLNLKEYICGLSLGWDSKRFINIDGRLSSLLYFLISGRWNGHKIKIFSLDLLDEDEKSHFYDSNIDVSKRSYDDLCSEFPETQISKL
jgi:hypothetical protein